MESLSVAKKCARFADDKKAEKITILDMREVVNFCDYFVLCTATSSRHIKAVADGIEDGLFEHGIKIKYKHGLDTAGRSRSFSLTNNIPSLESNGRWVLLDMGDVVVHIFENDSREFYGLDHLWQEAAPVAWS